MLGLNSRQRLISRICIYGLVIALLWLMEKASESGRDSLLLAPLDAEMSISDR